MGKLKPKFITEKGMTFPLRTKKLDGEGVVISDFLSKDLLEPNKGGKANKHLTNKEACYQFINECMQRAHTQAELKQ